MRQHARTAVPSRALVVGLIVWLGACAVPWGLARAAEKAFTTSFPMEQCTLVPNGRNAHFSLRPGDRLKLEGDDAGEFVTVEIRVLGEQVPLEFLTSNGVFLSVMTRVVQEREWKDGELVEVSRNYYVRCKETGDIYYLGEDVDIYEDGSVVSHDGAWRAGVDGALPGLIMPGTFLLGSRYYQEIAPGVAEDRAEHVRMGLTLDLPAGTFRQCVKVRETSPLEPGQTSIKRYCPGIGLVTDGPIRLVDYEIAGAPDPEE